MISSYPFFRPNLDRASAEREVAQTMCPIIRPSNVQGVYAITWLYNNALGENFKINHSMIREESCGRITNIACDKVAETWPSIHEAYCAFAWFSPLSLADIMKRAPIVESVEEDPTNYSG